MRVQLLRAIVAVAISSALGLGTAWAQAQAQPGQATKEWKDRAEYDLVQSIDKESSPQKKLELLNQWREKYSATDFKEERLVRYLDTYRALNRPAEMLETAKEILADDPRNFHGLWWASLLVMNTPNPTPDQLALAEKAGRGLLGILDDFFAPDKRPAATPEDAWKKARTDADAMGHRTLGWAAMQRKEYEVAEKELEQNLQLNPVDAEASFWLGTVILAQKNPEKQSEALFHFARAAAYDGPGALPAEQRQKVRDYISRTYTSYHGPDPEGFKELLALARTQTFPPPGFKILSEAEVQHQKEQELAQTNPQLAFWLKLKQALTSPEGEDYFERGMKGALVPPSDQPPLRGHVVRQEPARAPRTVVVALSNDHTPEVTLKLEDPLPGPAEPGTPVEFRGVVSNFNREPFMLTFDIMERKDLGGWPSPTPKKAAPKKKK